MLRTRFLIMPAASQRRHLQIGAGALSLLGTLRGLTVSPGVPKRFRSSSGTGWSSPGSPDIAAWRWGLRQAPAEPGDYPAR